MTDTTTTQTTTETEKEQQANQALSEAAKAHSAKNAEKAKKERTVKTSKKATKKSAKKGGLTKTRANGPVTACLCGCGTHTASTFAPGHDQRLLGWFLRASEGKARKGEPQKLSDLTKPQAEWARNRAASHKKAA